MKNPVYFNIFFTVLFVIKLIAETTFRAEVTKTIEIILYACATLKMVTLLFLYYRKKKTHA